MCKFKAWVGAGVKGLGYDNRKQIEVGSLRTIGFRARVGRGFVGFAMYGARDQHPPMKLISNHSWVC